MEGHKVVLENVLEESVWNNQTIYILVTTKAKQTWRRQGTNLVNPHHIQFRKWRGELKEIIILVQGPYGTIKCESSTFRLAGWFLNPGIKPESHEYSVGAGANGHDGLSCWLLLQFCPCTCTVKEESTSRCFPMTVTISLDDVLLLLFCCYFVANLLLFCC